MCGSSRVVGRDDDINHWLSQQFTCDACAQLRLNQWHYKLQPYLMQIGSTFFHTAVSHEPIDIGLTLSLHCNTISKQPEMNSFSYSLKRQIIIILFDIHSIKLMCDKLNYFFRNNSIWNLKMRHICIKKSNHKKLYSLKRSYFHRPKFYWEVYS